MPASPRSVKLDAPGLKRRGRAWGASLVGIADLERLRRLAAAPCLFPPRKY